MKRRAEFGQTEKYKQQQRLGFYGEELWVGQIVTLIQALQSCPSVDIWSKFNSSSKV